MGARPLAAARLGGPPPACGGRPASPPGAKGLPARISVPLRAVDEHSGRPVDLVGTPFHIAGASLPAPTAPPTLGQHTAEVLTNLLGMDAARLEELRRLGVI